MFYQPMMITAIRGGSTESIILAKKKNEHHSLFACIFLGVVKAKITLALGTYDKCGKKNFKIISNG